jgi:hypothetical protein
VTGAIIHGPWRTPVNVGAGAAGTIHDDAQARRHGFAGGTIAGSIHMEQYWGFLSELFGPGWINHGGLSLYFLKATTSGEAVRCSALRRDDEASVWMENRVGERISEGTADQGRDSDDGRTTAFGHRLAALRPCTSPALLSKVELGKCIPAISGHWPGTDVPARVAIITEPLPGYVEKPPILPADLAINLMRLVEPQIVEVPPGVVGLYGAIELRTFGEALRADTDYRLSGQVLAVGETPRTETLWYRSDAARNGKIVARMLHMARLLKS